MDRLFSDLCSFYKEEIAGETSNLVHDRALVSGKDITAALREMTNDMIEGVEKARLVLVGNREKGAWENFMAGYITYHRLSPRYRLDEVFGGDDA